MDHDIRISRIQAASTMRKAEAHMRSSMAAYNLHYPMNERLATTFKETIGEVEKTIESIDAEIYTPEQIASFDY